MFGRLNLYKMLIDVNNMKLQKHPSRKSKEGEHYYKYEVILPKDAVDKSGFREGDELSAEAKKGEIKLKKK